MFRRLARRTPKETAKAEAEWKKLLSGFLNLCKDRPMA
jgi:hypothetical protein